MDAIPVSATALDEPAMKSNNAAGRNLVVMMVAIELSGHVAGIVVQIAHVQNVALHSSQKANSRWGASRLS
jgi:hypothetical protein